MLKMFRKLWNKPAVPVASPSQKLVLVDKVPGSVTCDRGFLTMEIGEHAFTLFGWRVSKDGHVWLRRNGDVRKECSGFSSEMEVVREADGFYVLLSEGQDLGGDPPSISDAYYERDGFIRAGIKVWKDDDSQ